MSGDLRSDRNGEFLIIKKKMLNVILWIVGIVILFYTIVYLLKPAMVALVLLAVAGSIFGFWPGVIAAGIGFFWMLSIQFNEED